MYPLANKVEDELQNQIRSDVQYNWREETVVLNLLTSLRNVLHNRTTYSFTPYTIDFRIFQAFGKIETYFGDISLIIKIVFQNGDSLQGVGFMEAKIRNLNSFNFDSIRVNQLKRINSNAPRSLLLLLDYDPIYFTQNSQIRGFRFNNFINTTHSAVTQINSAIQLNKKDTNLYKISHPFVEQLFFRYFRGLDLEFGEKQILEARGYSEKRNFPKHTVFITLYPPDYRVDLDSDINGNMYEEIKK